MAKRPNSSIHKIVGFNRAVKTADSLANGITLHTITEIDFVTYGVKPRSCVFNRAACFLNSESAKSILRNREKSLLNLVFNLIEWYVRQQEIIFNPKRNFSDDWEKKVCMQLLMGGATHRYSQAVIKAKKEIEKFDHESEINSIALEIIHEYEIYCSHAAEIKKYVKSHNKLFSSLSSRRFYHFVLEHRDGSLCKGCGIAAEVENLQIDHLKPLTLGGNSDLENLQLLCKSCNESKGNRSMEYLIERIRKRRKSN